MKKVRFKEDGHRYRKENDSIGSSTKLCQPVVDTGVDSPKAEVYDIHDVSICSTCTMCYFVYEELITALHFTSVGLSYT